jgi:hypothetical protein
MMFNSKTRSGYRIAGIVAILAISASSCPALAVSQIPVPHRAIYKIGLADSEHSSGVTAADGRMVFEIAGNACEGYTMSQRLVVRIAHSENGEQLLDFRVSTFESGDGALYRFASRTYLDDQIVEEATGTAERQSESVVVALDNPSKKSLTFEQPVMFPSQHLLALLEAARQKQHFFSTSIYEGAGQGERTDVVSAVIGTAEEGGGAKGLIRGKTGWPVSMAYFSDNKEKKEQSGERTPDYQLSFTLYENGVTRDLKMNYGDYVLSGTLEKLDPLDISECAVR